MEGLLEFVQQPVFALAASALLLVVSIISLVSFWRAGKTRAARDAALAAQRELRAQFDAVMTSARDGVVITSPAGEILMMSDAAAHVLGVDKFEVTGRAVARIPVRAIDESMHSVNLQAVFAARNSQPDEPWVIGVPGRRGQEDVRWVRVMTKVVDDAYNGGPVTVATIVDASGVVAANDVVDRSDAQFRKAMENAPVGMALVDLEWRLMEVNRAFAEMMGSTVSALRGTPFSALSHPQDVGAERDQLQRLYDGHQAHFSLEKRFVKSDGNVVWAVLDVGLVRYTGGAPDHYVAQLRDSTDDRMHSELMAHRAMHDPLTGLANRNLMQEVLQNVLDKPELENGVGVIACDLDGFKGLNDRFGHATGDTALIHVATVLRQAAGGRGTVARVGGDEFVIVVQDPEGAKAVFEIAAAIHEGLRRPLQVKRHQINLRASVGIAMAEPDVVTDGATSLLTAADAAMYRAKLGGKSRTEVYTPSMRTEGDNTSTLARELREAIAAGDLVLHYQPILELSDRTVVGYEALVRWQHPTRGLLLPGAFLPLLDDRALSVQLGSMLVDQVAGFLGAAPNSQTWVSLNVGADQLGDSEFADRVLTAIARHHLSPQRIVIELTEASLVSPNTRIRHELTELRNAGVPILLDDFGTGVSPLSYLRDLPVSGVKLDMSFTAGIPEDPAGARVSRALGALARELGLATIAEGIETESQAEFLRSCGWRYGQGWLFGVAQPAAAALDGNVEYSESLIDPRPTNDDELLAS